MQVIVEVHGRQFTATLADTAAAAALYEMVGQHPVTLHLSDYAGFEKVCPLGRRLPAQDRQITTHCGDIVLYQGNQIVMFYGSNSWDYTRIGKIDDPAGWQQALGRGNVTVTFQPAGA